MLNRRSLRARLPNTTPRQLCKSFLMKRGERSLSLKLTTMSTVRGGSAFGWDAGAKFGLTKKDEGKYAHASQESVEMMHISYNVSAHTAAWLKFAD
jgi:hypothetical protein